MQRLGKTIVGVLGSLVGSLALHVLVGGSVQRCGPLDAPTTELGTPAGEIDIDTLEPGAGTSGASTPAPPEPPPPPPPPKPSPLATPPRSKPAEPLEQAEDVQPEPAPLPMLPAPEPAEPTPPNAPNAAPAAADPGSGDPNGLAAQRGRLGAAATCTDPVAGTWRASFYDRARSQWYEFTLAIQRDGSMLAGTITSRFWLGPGSNSRTPSSCRETPLYAVVAMPARGVFGEGRVRFGSSSWTLQHLYCGPSVSYTPDRFAGTVDAAKNEFQSLVSDGMNLIDQPLLLRRIGCPNPPR